jgi:hypothetical protein
MDVRRAISSAQRFGVWKAWKGRCFWCREPVYFRDCHIDHLLPLASASKLNLLIERYSLPSDFNINGFENWIPSHPGCNQRKGDTLIDPSPAFALYLTQVRTLSGLAKAVANNIEQDHRKAPLLAKLEAAISAGDISQAEIQDLISGLPMIVKKGFEVPDEHIFIAPGWEIIERKGGRDIALVRAPGGTGITSLAPDADYSWTCPTCGNRGPWDGVICRSCGSRHMPDC